MADPRPENLQRTARRVAITFLANDAEMAAMEDLLEVLVCGDDRHSGACVVPWSQSSVRVALSKKERREEFDDLSPIPSLSEQAALQFLRARRELLMENSVSPAMEEPLQ